MNKSKIIYSMLRLRSRCGEIASGLTAQNSTEKERVMNARKTQAEGRKTADLEVVTVTKSAVKSTMGGSGPIQEIDVSGGTKYG